MSNRAQSVMKLRKLEFDPIEKLVETYEGLQKELEIQEKMRTGDVVQLNANGRVINYRMDVHHALYDKMINIGDKLLRFGYARVPETSIIENDDRKPLIINLDDKSYAINENEAKPLLAESFEKDE